MTPRKKTQKKTPIISVKDLFKTFKTGTVITPVLKGIDLEIYEGEFIAIMGRSGAGKSTLMYQMSLLDTPTSGEIKIEGTETATLTNSDRTTFRLFELGYIFQDYALLPELSAQENVMIPLIMQGITRKLAKKMASAALESVGLGDRLRNRPSQLSGGEQQRVSIARATAHNPKIIFADEPTANLDQASSKVILDIFTELHKAGQTIIMVTHEKEYATYAESLIMLDDGKISSRKKTTKK